MNKAPEELYEERERRVEAAIALKTPDRVPVMCLWGFFPAKYTGSTFEESMYDYDMLMKSSMDTMVDFQPDMCDNPFPVRYLGPTLEALDFRQLKWPGHGCDAMSTYQYVEGEYMKADEYDAFLFDPSGFMMRMYWPRVSGALEPFRNLPPMYSIISYYMGLMAFSAFDSPEIEAALEALLKAAKEAKRILSGAIAYATKMQSLGFPQQFGGLAQAPFDTLSTGTPDDVKAYCKELIDVMGKDGGFIMDASTVLDDARPENVRAMIEFTKEYAVYR